MKIRISNYKFAHSIFKILRFLLCPILFRKKSWFIDLEGKDADAKEEWGEPDLIDKYYLLWFE